jgi:myosin protein heavy chain
LDDIKNYRFLTNGYVPVSGVDDTQEFRMTVEAMTIMGISPEDQAGMYLNNYNENVQCNGY